MEIAKSLFNDEYYDVSISRAYFAMFYVAEAFLLLKNLGFSKHSAVISGFGKEFVANGLIPQEFHRYLLDGLDKRADSDYEGAYSEDKEEAEDQIQRAEEFVKFAETKLDTLLK